MDNVLKENCKIIDYAKIDNSLLEAKNNICLRIYVAENRINYYSCNYWFLREICFESTIKMSTVLFKRPLIASSTEQMIGSS